MWTPIGKTKKEDNVTETPTKTTPVITETVEPTYTQTTLGIFKDPTLQRWNTVEIAYDPTTLTAAPKVNVIYQDSDHAEAIEHFKITVAQKGIVG